MEFSLFYAREVMRRCISEPRILMDEIMSLQLARGTIIQGLTLFSVVNVLILYLSWITGPEKNLPEQVLAVLPNAMTPLTFGMIFLYVLTIVAGAAVAGGLAFGGTGKLNDILVGLSIWVFFQMVTSFAQLLLSFLSVALAGLFSIVCTVATYWLLCQLMAQLHGFRSALAVFLLGTVAMMVVSIGISIIVSILLVLLGVAPA